MFWEISDILWKCFGFHWLAKLAEIIKTCGKNQCFWRSLTTYGRALKSQVGRSHHKKQKNAENSGKKRVFSPLLFRPGDIFIFISIYSPAITCSHFKFRPSPTYWPTVCLPIYLYVCIYMCVCIYFYIYIYLPAITCSHFKFRPSPTYWPTVCLPIYLYVYIHIYVCMYIFFIVIYLLAITCSHSKFRPSPTYWPTVCLPIYLKCIYIYICIYFYIYVFTCNHLQSF